MDAKVQEIFNIIDKDNSNSIELPEFTAYAGLIPGLVLPNQTPEQVFSIIDVNNDGSLSPEEIKAYILANLSQFQ